VAIVAVVVIVWAIARAMRWARKGSTGASMLAAAAFPFPDQPPPNEQVEHESRIRKDAESGDPKGD
jgi:hypothetical protein